MKPIIGITTYGRNEVPIDSRYYDAYFSVPAAYVDAVRRAGGVAVLLPPGEVDWAHALAALDGLIITGGADINPEVYGGDSSHPNLTRLDHERDEMELSLVRHLVDVGFREVGVSPVASGHARFDLDDDDLQVLLRGVTELADDFVAWAKEGKIFPFSNIRTVVEQIASGDPRAMPCGQRDAQRSHSPIRQFAGVCPLADRTATTVKSSFGNTSPRCSHDGPRLRQLASLVDFWMTLWKLTLPSSGCSAARCWSIWR